jgi:arabinofuranosyltransferase
MSLMKRDRTALLLAAVLGFAGVAAYVAYASAAGYAGFPLDDGWIHQTYARNLVQMRAWAYVPGEVSAGSTSPLWTLLLALGYALGVPYRLWAVLMGGLSVGAVAWMTGQLSRQLFPRVDAGWAAAIACALEWHLVWAGASGMETALFSALCLGVMSTAIALARDEQPIRWLAWGALGGAAFLTRPEGLLPVGLAGLGLMAVRRRDFSRGSVGRALQPYGLALVGFLALALPYLAFNWKTTGAPLPNTFYAKQAEYWEMIAALPWLTRAMRVAGVQLVGGAALLLPGIIAACVELGKQRKWLAFLPLAWWLAMVLLYAFRLPVTYQHGRYQMPVIPALIVYGVPGTALLLSRAYGLAQRVAIRGLAVAACVAFVAFAMIGAGTYLADVRIIDTEMVDVARWLDANTPPDAVIAAHDIGAVGYFTERRLLDLAGLISPEVIPFIRDESRLYAYVREQGASYLVTFPSWYPKMTAHAGVQLVYQTRSPWTVRAGGDNMAVYRLPAEGRQP